MKTEKLSDLPKVSQLFSDQFKAKTQVSSRIKQIIALG